MKVEAPPHPARFYPQTLRRILKKISNFFYCSPPSWKKTENIFFSAIPAQNYTNYTPKHAEFNGAFYEF